MTNAELLAAQKRLLTVPCLAPGLCAGECVNLITELIHLRQKVAEVEASGGDKAKRAVMMESLRQWLAGIAIVALFVAAHVLAVAWIVL